MIRGIIEMKRIYLSKRKLESDWDKYNAEHPEEACYLRATTFLCLIIVREYGTSKRE